MLCTVSEISEEQFSLRAQDLPERTVWVQRAGSLTRIFLRTRLPQSVTSANTYWQPLGELPTGLQKAAGFKLKDPHRSSRRFSRTIAVQKTTFAQSVAKHLE